jgi:hypothetical protein
MDTRPVSDQKKVILDYLRAGWQLFLIADKPFPSPQTVLLIRKDERQAVPYNIFLALQGDGAIAPKGRTLIGGEPAEEFHLSE